MHPLLARQIRKILREDIPQGTAFQILLQAVSDAYVAAAEDRKQLLERFQRKARDWFRHFPSTR